MTVSWRMNGNNRRLKGVRSFIFESSCQPSSEKFNSQTGEKPPSVSSRMEKLGLFPIEKQVQLASKLWIPKKNTCFSCCPSELQWPVFPNSVAFVLRGAPLPPGFKSGGWALHVKTISDHLSNGAELSSISFPNPWGLGGYATSAQVHPAHVIIKGLLLESTNIFISQSRIHHLLHHNFLFNNPWLKISLLN